MDRKKLLTVGFFAAILLGLFQRTAEAAITIQNAAIASGALTITGTTQPRVPTVTLQISPTQQVSVTTDEKGTFEYSGVIYPPTCVVVVSGGGETQDALVADCAPAAPAPPNQIRVIERGCNNVDNLCTPPSCANGETALLEWCQTGQDVTPFVPYNNQGCPGPLRSYTAVVVMCVRQ
jgi:hypothetical protein